VVAGIARIGQRWEDLTMTIWPENSAEYASWVQAIGSVAAVVVTLVVMFCQFSNQRKTKEREQKELIKRYIESAISLGGGVDQKAQKLNQWASALSLNPGDLTFMRAEVETISAALNQLPIWQIDNFEAIKTIVCLQTHAVVLVETLKTAESQWAKGINWTSGAQNKLATLIPDIQAKLPELIAIAKNY